MEQAYAMGAIRHGPGLVGYVSGIDWLAISA